MWSGISLHMYVQFKSMNILLGNDNDNESLSTLFIRQLWKYTCHFQLHNSIQMMFIDKLDSIH